MTEIDGRILITIVLIVAAFVLGWRLGALRQRKRAVELETTLDLERARGRDMEKNFSALSAEALRANNDTFLKLAQEKLMQFQLQSKNELEQKEKAVEHLIQPIRAALEKSEQQIRLMEHERKEAYGALHKHLETMAQAQQALQGETRNLVQALRRPEVRGQWGELTLKRLTELAGMVEYCDFYPQESHDTDDGRLRPDMVVRLPAGREIVVDVKTPLDAYLSAIEATDDDSRRRHLESHAQKVRARVKELAAKAYWNQFERAPDFVVLFIPGDQFLAAALDIDRALLEDALRQKVILATPTSFVALLRAIAFGWRQEALAENAQQIRDAGEELYRRLATFAEHVAKIGRGLDGAVDAYNKAVGSFESKLLPGARRLTDLGVHPPKTLEEPAHIEQVVRELSDER